MDNIYKLSDAPLNAACVITDVSCPLKERRRLLDLGFFEGEKVLPLYESPLGGTKAYLIKDALIALRPEDAAKITVKLERSVSENDSL